MGRLPPTARPSAPSALRTASGGSVRPRVFDGDPREGRPNAVQAAAMAAGRPRPAVRGSGPRPRQGLISMPRGNGKTSLAAVLGAYGLYADGVEGAEVVVVASDARQAGITLPQVARMVELNPLLADRTQVFANRLYVPHSDFTLVVLPAEPGALQAGILRAGDRRRAARRHPRGLGLGRPCKRQAGPVSCPGHLYTRPGPRRHHVGSRGAWPSRRRRVVRPNRVRRPGGLRTRRRDRVACGEPGAR
jgi:hypothetical protein